VEQYVGLDVSLELTSVCVVDSGGKSLWQGKCVSTPEAIAATIRARAPGWRESVWKVVRCRLGTGTS
jgi:transposase